MAGDAVREIVSVKTLMGALVAVGSMALGIMTFDAERFIGNQEKMNSTLSSLAADVKVAQTNIGMLQESDVKQWAKIGKHDVNIATLQTRVYGKPTDD